MSQAMPGSNLQAKTSASSQPGKRRRLSNRAIPIHQLASSKKEKEYLRILVFIPALIVVSSDCNLSTNPCVKVVPPVTTTLLKKVE